MAKIEVILLCAVTVGGPVLDAKGAVKSSNEKTLPPGSRLAFEEEEASRLVALGAARLYVADTPPAEPPPPPPPPPADQV